jgi:hypothetical protein
MLCGAIQRAAWCWMGFFLVVLQALHCAMNAGLLLCIILCLDLNYTGYPGLEI